MTASLPNEVIAPASHGPAYYCMKHGSRAIVNALIYLYLFRYNVCSYFAQDTERRWKAVLSHVAICAMLVVAFSISARALTQPSADTRERAGLAELFARGEFEMVVDGSKEYLRRKPRSPEVLSQLGWAYMELELLDEAESCFAMAVEIEPHLNDAYVGLGVICYAEACFDEARMQFEKAVSLSPDSDTALTYLLVIELHEGNDAKAIEYGERAWALDDSNTYTAANLAIAYHQVGDLNKRNIFFRHAKRLGYEGLQGLTDIFEGRATIR